MMSSLISQRTWRARQVQGVSLPLVLALAVVVAVVAWRLVGRVQAADSLAERTQEQALPTVSVTHPLAARAEALVLPATVQAWEEAPIYARTGGYLKRWLVDIGQPVKAGALLAEIDAPEVDQQLRQAQADLATAQANNRLAQSTAKRYRQLLQSDSVAPQDAEDRFGDAQAKAAAENSALANVQRLQELVRFERVVAPFDGVVTERGVDVGALVVAGGAAGTPLFKVASTKRLRLYVQVPETLAALIAPHQTARFRMADQAKAELPAQVISTASAIDPVTRTMLVQLAYDNRAGKVLVGGYAEVHFDVAPRAGVLRLPSNALLFRGDGLNVAVVDPTGHVRLHGVVQGRDFGKEVEILSGVKAEDQVVLNPSDSIVDGLAVHPRAAPVAASASAASAVSGSVK